VSRAYVTKHTRDNVFVAHWQVVLTDNFKHDSVGLDYSGTDLLVIGTGHDTTEGGSRDYEACEAVIPGVFVNRGGGLLPGRGGASTPLEPEPQEGEPVDYGRIERMINTAVDGLAQSFGDDGPRKAIFDKAGDSLLYMTDPANRDREYKTGHYQDVVYQRDLQRQYEALNKHIIGENPALPIENQGYIELIKRCVREVLQEIDEPTEGETING